MSSPTSGRNVSDVSGRGNVALRGLLEPRLLRLHRDLARQCRIHGGNDVAESSLTFDRWWPEPDCVLVMGRGGSRANFRSKRELWSSSCFKGILMEDQHR